jgi:hypothetical protein
MMIAVVWIATAIAVRGSLLITALGSSPQPTLSS